MGQRLDGLGTALGIAFGCFGELSPGLEKRLAEAAQKLPEGGWSARLLLLLFGGVPEKGSNL